MGKLDSYYRTQTIQAYPSTMGDYANKKGLDVGYSARSRRGYVIIHGGLEQWVTTERFLELNKASHINIEIV